MAAAATALGADAAYLTGLPANSAAARPHRRTGRDSDDLIRFAVSPSKHFARYRLGLHWTSATTSWTTTSRSSSSALQSWQLKSDLADWDQSSEGTRGPARRGGRAAAPGNMAEIQHRESAGEVAELREALLSSFSGHNATAEWTCR